MKVQHKFKTNQLGYTYSEWGQNLINQLNLNYSKLHGESPIATRKSTKGKPRSNRQNATRV